VIITDNRGIPSHLTAHDALFLFLPLSVGLEPICQIPLKELSEICYLSTDCHPSPFNTMDIVVYF
jgi:hypothetical protein